jgi:hypothetical protein
MGNRIEIAKSGRSKCVTCNEPIAKGTPRLSEEYNDIGIPDLIHRFYHLKCAAAVHPEVVAAALANVDHGVEFDRAEIEAKIAPAVARATELRKQKYLAQQAERDAKTQTIIIEADEQTTALLSQLDADPEDPGTLAVVADQLQARGDIRGELIALQLATVPVLSLEGDDDEETDASERTNEIDRRSRRTAEIMDKLSVPLDAGDRAIWGVGFIRRLELHGKTGSRLSALAPIWKHPSLRLLSELLLTLSSTQDTPFVARLHEFIPRTLSRLEIGDDGAQALSGLAGFIALLPRLDVLQITGKSFATRAEPLKHPTLRHLRLGIIQRGGQTELPGTLPFLSPKSLPAVESIVIRPGSSLVEDMFRRDRLGLTATSLGANGWFKRPLALGWINTNEPVTTDDVTQLAEALGKKKLAKLDLTGTKIPIALREKLAQLATELVAPDLEILDDQALYIEHVNKPEWGRGKVVSRKEGKVEVDFGKKVGKKVFKADAPFLKMIA